MVVERHPDFAYGLLGKYDALRVTREFPPPYICL
jgi:hypothetical protein